MTALLAVLAGLATIIAGGRILLGLAEAGYVVVRPVLYFNLVMGVLYLVTAVLIVRRAPSARGLAAGVALANVVVLALAALARGNGGAVAGETVVAMLLRSALWIGIAAALMRARGARTSHAHA
ncbi:MAG TPA: hypothetical protein VFZ21_02745 [Gemmatimonadaceae bacterium]|nr:hypothetical protein [Gemmatimonadaceae bacterium]